jgi:hypothetical protein
MKIFKKIINGILHRDKFTEIIENSEQIATSLVEEEYFESSTVVSIASGMFLDASSPINIAKYKSNLRILVKGTRQKRNVNEFMIIRNDDFFPTDWEWCVSSSETGVEKTGSYFAYALRKEIARENSGMSLNPLFDVPMDSNKMNLLLDNIDKDVGRIYQPVKYRSTKHFTINTPLSYTGDYNNVDSARAFHVIDKIDNFIESGYAYSASYRDAYLDVTHESLPLSEDAVVLISEDKYADIANNHQLIDQLEGRKVIIFRGDEALATNMVLTEMGILPSRPGNKYMTYDNDVLEILESSMMNFCQVHSIEYDKGHGNIDGKGGHFSDIYDGYNQEGNNLQEDFFEFLKSKFPDHINIISATVFNSEDASIRLIREIGTANILQAIDEYNAIALDKSVINLRKYKENRKIITPEISLIFKNTVKLIIDYFNSGMKEYTSMEFQVQIDDLIRLFYHGKCVEDQLLAATELSQKLGISIVSNMRFDDATEINRHI